MDTFDYHKLTNTNGNELIRLSSDVQRFVRWSLVNKLPASFHLYLKRGKTLFINDEVLYLGEIKDYETLNFKYDTLREGDLLIVLFKYINTNNFSKHSNYLAMQPYSIRSFQRTVFIGDTVYNEEGAATASYLSSYEDLPGVWIHNELLFPLNIYYKGQLVSQLGPYDGMTYQGGSAATIWFDDQRRGLKFDSPISIEFATGNPSVDGIGKQKRFSVYLYDNKMRNIYVGVINGNHNGPPPDTFSYSVDQPTFTGLTYYIPTGNGTSVPTNPIDF